jgi:hypothetical protein
MFRELQKPAHYAIVENGKVSLTRYWQPELYGGPYLQSEQEYLEQFAEQFERSVRMRLISEVPLGAYLSGGVDSGTIVAVMAKLLDQPVRTFTVGFDFQHDELADARATAEGLGCRHTEIACRAEDIELLHQMLAGISTSRWAIPSSSPCTGSRMRPSRSPHFAGESAEKRSAVICSSVHSWPGIGWPQRYPLPSGAPASLAGTSGFIAESCVRLSRGTGAARQLKVLDSISWSRPASQAFRHLISLFDERDTRDLYGDSFGRILRLGGETAAGDGHRHPTCSESSICSFRIAARRHSGKTGQDVMASGIEAGPVPDYQLVNSPDFARLAAWPYCTSSPLRRALSPSAGRPAQDAVLRTLERFLGDTASVTWWTHPLGASGAGAWPLQARGRHPVTIAGSWRFCSPSRCQPGDAGIVVQDGRRSSGRP